MSNKEALEILCKGIAPNPTANNECIKLCKSALEKQIPKKPKIKELTIGYLNGEKIKGSYYHCPCCKIFLGLDAKIYKFCPRCGQALDWSDTE